MSAQYDITAVARSQAQSTAPTFSELAPLFASLSFTESVLEADSAEVTVSLETLDDAVKQRLRDLVAEPMEIWIYRDGVHIFSGTVTGGNISGPTVSLAVKAIPYYMSYMLVTTDKTYTNVDQFTIAKELVDDWQALDYGNFGLVTSGIGTSSILRTSDIPGALEPIAVSEVVYPMGAADNGFDVSYVPSTRALVFTNPEKGSDLSASVFLERGIQSPNVRFSVSPGIVASDVYLTGTSAEKDPITATASTASVRSTFGRTGVAGGIDKVSSPSLLSDFADAWAAERATALFQPGGGLIPVAGAEYSDFAAGDTVSYGYDAGLGFQSGSYRILRRKVTVADNGTETMEVEFS